MDVFSSWVAKRVLDAGLQRLLSRPAERESFESACARLCEEYPELFSQLTLEALAEAEWDESVSAEPFAFPQPDEVVQQLQMQWLRVRAELPADQRHQFFAMPEEEAVRILRRFATLLFEELAQAPSRRDPFVVRTLQEIKEAVSVGHGTPRERELLRLLDVADAPQNGILRFQREVQRLRRAGKIVNIGMNLPPEYDNASRAFHESISNFEGCAYSARRHLTDEAAQFLYEMLDLVRALLNLETSIRHGEVDVERTPEFRNVMTSVDRLKTLLEATLTSTANGSLKTAPVARVTLTNGTIQELRADSVRFRVNDDSNLGSTRRSVRISVDGKTYTYDVSHLSQILGPTRRHFVDYCSPQGEAEELTVTVRGNGNMTGHVLDTCDVRGRRRLALTGFDSAINNTITINFSAIARVELP